MAQNWLRQQSKDFYAAGFDTLVKICDKCINVYGEYVEKEMLFPSSNVTMFYVLYPFVINIFTGSPSYINFCA
jgi:hypothetical protein